MGPFIKDNNKTSKIMFHLLISLTPIIIFAFIKNGVIPYMHGTSTIQGMFYPLLFILVSTLATYVFEAIYELIFTNKNIKDIIKNFYSIFPGLFLALILPINTPIIIVIIGAFISSIIAKMLFGGFGNNIFNPALVGRLFIITMYAVVIGQNGGYLNTYEIDTITQSTPLTNASLLANTGTYETLVKPYGSLLNFFIGTIPGALGETSSLLCILAFIYLTFFKVIKWKIPVTYILTVFAMTYVIGGINNQGMWYPLFQILSGGLMFGAVFMATDPVTSPVTPIGQILYGMFLGILTVIFRFLTPFPEGVLTSILTMNMFVMILDKIGAQARFNFKITFIPFLIAWLLILLLSISISIIYSSDKETDSNYNIINKKIEGKKTTYTVTQKGYSGNIKADIVIDEGKIIDINILEQHDSFYSKITEENYIEKLENTNGNIDTITGVTITSNALKTMIKNTLNDYNGKIEIQEETNKTNEDQNFQIISKTNIDDKIEYIVTQKSFGGNIKLQVTLLNNTIENINILEQNDSYFNMIIENNYINTIIENQTNIDTLDTVSGATISSNSIKKAIKNIMLDYNGDING